MANKNSLAPFPAPRREMMMENKLKEIRKRDELYNGQFTTIVYSDRRRLLVEVDAQREELERLRAIETNVKGIILFLLRHLQEIRETASGDPGVKYAIEIGYLDCLGTLKDALFEAAPAEEE